MAKLANISQTVDSLIRAVHFVFSAVEMALAYTAQVQRSLRAASGRPGPLGYVFMLGGRPKGPMRATRAEALRDAVEAREAFVDPDLGVTFQGPLTWLASIWP